MPIQDLHVEKHINLLIRTVVKQLNVLLNQGQGSCVLYTSKADSIAALHLCSQDHNSRLFLFFALTSKLYLSQKRTISQVLHLISKSLVLRSFMALDGLLIIQI